MCAQIKQNCFSVSVVMVALIVMVVAMVCSIRLVTIGLTHQIILCGHLRASTYYLKATVTLKTIEIYPRQIIINGEWWPIYSLDIFKQHFKAHT